MSECKSCNDTGTIHSGPGATVVCSWPCPHCTDTDTKLGEGDMVNHPEHYKVGGIETIDFIEAKRLGFHEGNAVKYIARAKFKNNELQDLQKARWYLDRVIERLS